MKFELVRRTMIYEEVVKQLKELIRDGDLEPGEQLPTIKELAEQFQVSQGSIRQALSVLESLRLIENKGYSRSYYVAQLSSTKIEPLIEELMRNTDEIKQVFELRKILEPELCRMAAEKASTEQIELIEKCIENHKRKVENGEFAIEEDADFHFTVIKASGNEVALSIIDRARDMVAQLKEYSSILYNRNEKLYEDHCQIFLALERRDGMRAYEAMRAHLEGVEALLIGYIENPDY